MTILLRTKFRSEKKSLKAILKLGMKTVKGVTLVMFFAYQKRCVQDDFSTQLQLQAAQQFRMPDMNLVMATKSEPANVTIAGQVDEEEEEEEVDESGVEDRDIDLVMTRAGVSKNKAAKALKTHNENIVCAIWS